MQNHQGAAVAEKAPQLPKISVIVVTYNQEATIGCALDSVLCQDYGGKMEVIVCDDASTDGTADVCRRYAERYPDRVRVVVNPENKGLFRNYFDAVAMATGDYIADCAGDDVWSGVDRLSRLARVLTENPEVGMVCGKWTYRSEGECPPMPDWRFGDVSVVFDDCRFIIRDLINAVSRPAPYIFLSAALYRRLALAEQIKLHPALFTDSAYVCEDMQIIAAMAASGQMAFLPEVVSEYTVGGVSVSSMEERGKTARFAMATLRLRFDLAQAYGVDWCEISDYMTELTQFVLANTFRAGDASLRRELLDFADAHGIRLPLKGRVLRVLSGNGRLWRMVRRLL